MAGYHLATINKGVLGELSKVREEVEEAMDAQAQGVKIMLLVELSDMIGAMKAVAEKNQLKFSDIIAIYEGLAQTQKKPRGSLAKINHQLVLVENNFASGVKIRLAADLANLLNEVVNFSKKNGASLEDLIKMQEVTERAFKTGHRQ